LNAGIADLKFEISEEGKAKGKAFYRRDAEVVRRKMRTEKDYCPLIWE
jgi:hypothetical protein